MELASLKQNVVAFYLTMANVHQVTSENILKLSHEDNL